MWLDLQDWEFTNTKEGILAIPLNHNKNRRNYLYTNNFLPGGEYYSTKKGSYKIVCLEIDKYSYRVFGKDYKNIYSLEKITNSLDFLLKD